MGGHLALVTMDTAQTGQKWVAIYIIILLHSNNLFTFLVGLVARSLLQLPSQLEFASIPSGPKMARVDKHHQVPDDAETCRIQSKRAAAASVSHDSSHVSFGLESAAAKRLRD